MKKFLHLQCKRIIAFAIACAMVFTTVITDGAVVVQAAAVTFSESAGYEEGAYAEWAPVSGANGYKAYVSMNGGAYTQVDNELIREYSNYWRVDAVGLAAGTYKIKVEAVNGSSVVASAETGNLTVTNYDRSGFAFSSISTHKTGSGAYNDNGTLKSGAQVIYVTSKTAKTVKATIGGKEVTGLQAILTAKGKDTKTPLCVRIIGCVEKSNLDSVGSSSQGIQIKGSSSYNPMHVTIEGIGEDAAVSDFGFLVRNTGNVEFRNFAILNFMDDGISLDTDNENIWVHDMDFFYGGPGSDSDQAKGDGTLDLKNDTRYCTFSYNHFWDSGKASLCGMKSESGNNYITYHHNWFDHSDSRHPRIRTMSVHVYNNYYDGVSKYGVGAALNSEAFVESNYFQDTHLPMLSSMQGNDVTVGEGIFSGENGGIIKAYDNIVVNATALTYQNSNAGTTPANATEFDAYLVSSRSETVPSSVKAKQGGKTYSNFDTKVDLGVDASDITPVANVPSVVSAKAGRLNGGDLKWDFSNPSEDKNYDIISGLKSAVTNYQPSVKTVGGVSGVSTPSGGSSTTPTAVPQPTAAPGATAAPTSKPSGGGSTIVGGQVHNFTTSDKNSSYYSITGNLSTSKGTVSYNGLTLTQCLKMESTTNISFTTDSNATLVLVFGGSTDASGKRVKVDGDTYTIGSDNILTTTLSAGSHTVTKGDSINLFYMAVSTEGGSVTPSNPTAAPTAAPTAKPSNPSATAAPTSAPIVPQDGDIFVSPSGSSSAAGTQSAPMDFKTALSKITAGHTIWMMDGTYTFSSTILIEESNAGKSGAYKRVSSINDGEVILNFNMEEASSNRGIVLDGSYWHFYGVDICNAGDNGMLLSGDNNIIEMCQFYKNHDSGLQLSRYNTSYNSVSQWPSNNLIKNCTSFNNKDEATTENADGFAAKLTCGNGNVFDGCIAYCNCDDGWDLYAKPATGSIGVVTIKNCVAFGNGKTSDGTGSSNGDMNGFKLGGSNGECPTPHVIENCLAFNNGATGFTDNGNGGAMVMKNCTSVNNGVYDAKANYVCYRTSSGATYTDLLSFMASDSGETDYYKGKLDNVLYHYKSAGYYWVDSHTASGSKEKYSGSEAKNYTVTASDFVSTTIPGYTASGSKYATDYHERFRAADGTIDMGGLFDLKSSSPLAKAATDGGRLGSDFTDITVTPTPTAAPTAKPNPTAAPTAKPTAAPSTPTAAPTAAPTAKPNPTAAPGTSQTHTFDATLLTMAADKEAMTNDQFTDNYFSVTGTVTKRGTAPAVKAVELAKSSGGSINFTITGTATVTVGAMSTGSTNTSAFGIVDASGNAIANAEGATTVTGRDTTVLTYTLNAGTYSIVSPQNSSYSRGVQVIYIDVVETAAGGSAVPTPAPTAAPTPAPTAAPTPAPTAAPEVVTGEITSFIDDSEVTIELIPAGATAPVKTVTSTNGTYSITGVANGNYTMRVSKTNHVTRDYDVTITNNTLTQSVKLCPIGDVTEDGTISVADYVKVLAATKGNATLSEYAAKCADVNGDTNISVVDYVRILAHAKGSASLW